MGKFKDMAIQQSEEPINVAYFGEFDITTDFDGNALIDTSDDEPRPQPQAKLASIQRLQERAQSKPAAAPATLPIGNLVAGMDLNDPAHVAELAARYTSMNESMKRLAQEKAHLVNVLDRADDAVAKSDAKLIELQRTIDDMGKELAHAKEKLDIATKSCGAIFERTVFSVLKWGGIGSALLFVTAFLYF